MANFDDSFLEQTNNISLPIDEDGNNRIKFHKKNNEYWSFYRNLFKNHKSIEDCRVYYATELEHNVTSVQSLKINIYKNNSWPYQSVENTNSFSQTVLVKEKISNILELAVGSLCTIPELEKLDDITKQVALRLVGSVEYLPRDACLGKIPSIARQINEREDLNLELCFLDNIPEPKITIDENNYSYNHLPEHYFKNHENDYPVAIEKLKDLLSSFEPSNSNCKRAIRSAVYHIGYLCNNIITPEGDNTLVRLFACENQPSEELKIKFLDVFISLIKTYLDSSLSPFTLSFNYEESLEKESVPAYKMNQKFVLTVNSIHNIPLSWTEKYISYRIVTMIVHGTDRIGKWISSTKTLNNFQFSPYVNISNVVEFDLDISNLPKNCILFFMLYGVGSYSDFNSSELSDIDTSARLSSTYEENSIDSKFGADYHYSREEYLGSSVYSIFDKNGFFKQGPVFLSIFDHGLSKQRVIEPWGLQSILLPETETILYIETETFEHEIMFESIESQSVIPKDFDSLPFDQRELLTKIIINNQITYNLSVGEKELVWCRRHYLMEKPEALAIVLRSNVSWDSAHMSQVLPLLQLWKPISPTIALELLMPYFANTEVRNYAVNVLRQASTELIYRMIPQLIQCLRYEFHNESELLTFLVEKAMQSKILAFEIYWNITSIICHCEFLTFKIRLETLIYNMTRYMDVRNFSEDISRQQKMNNLLTECVNDINSGYDSKRFKSYICHLRPSFIINGLNVDSCSVFQSNTKPIKLVLKNYNLEYSVIYKVGDDLRQDALVLQCVNLMNDIWLRYNLDLRMTTYEVLPTNINKGYIEMVPNCQSLYQIHSLHGAAGIYNDQILYNWLQKYNPDFFAFRIALENFRKSCAGWCVATYLLGIGDRHNNNIMLTKSGNVFHIDFGKYLGDWQMAAGFRRDRVPFIFTKEMRYVIDKSSSGDSSSGYQNFVNDCCRAYNLIRKDCRIILNALKLMKSSGISGLNETSIKFVESNLQLCLSEEDAIAYFTRMIKESLDSYFPRLNFVAHTVANRIKNFGLHRNITNGSENNNAFSFSIDVNTIEQDGRITNVIVHEPEKWKKTDKDKVYMYKMKIKRENENVPTYIYRSFDEFQELYAKLVKMFSKQQIPHLCKDTFGRQSNNAMAANQKHAHVINFIDALFKTSPEICESNIVYTFFHSIYRDVDSDQIKAIQYRDNDQVLQFTKPQLYLRITYLKQEAALQIFVGHAQYLPMVGANQQPSPYVKIYLEGEGHTKLKRKTNVVKCTQNPAFNEVVKYNINQHCLRNMYTHLKISIWHSPSNIVSENYELLSFKIEILKILDAHKKTEEGNPILDGWFAMERQVYY
uniref:Phosphatidylinositol 3-kinase catalytic subunit type 3 n=1 Tax=Parastrongyloides trichosuri TaxID=131310 RepID=A0A0N4ZB74_PARTI